MSKILMINTFIEIFAKRALMIYGIGKFIFLNPCLLRNEISPKPEVSEKSMSDIRLSRNQKSNDTHFLAKSDMYRCVR